LATIHTAEQLYHASNGSYTDDFAVLGVSIADDAIYSYGITATASTFTTTATANLDDDATEDTWTINQDKQLVQTTDDLTDQFFISPIPTATALWMSGQNHLLF
jgi:hypothetical protein